MDRVYELISYIWARHVQDDGHIKAYAPRSRGRAAYEDWTA